LAPEQGPKLAEVTLRLDKAVTWYPRDGGLGGGCLPFGGVLH